MVPETETNRCGMGNRWTCENPGGVIGLAWPGCLNIDIITLTCIIRNIDQSSCFINRN